MSYACTLWVFTTVKMDGAPDTTAVRGITGRHLDDVKLADFQEAAIWCNAADRRV